MFRPWFSIWTLSRKPHWFRTMNIISSKFFSSSSSRQCTTKTSEYITEIVETHDKKNKIHELRTHGTDQMIEGVKIMDEMNWNMVHSSGENFENVKNFCDLIHQYCFKYIGQRYCSFKLNTTSTKIVSNELNFQLNYLF